MRGKLRSRDTIEGPGDDWLAEQGELDWRDPRRDERSPAAAPAASGDSGANRPTARPRVGRSRERSSVGSAVPATIVRRRRIGALVVFGLLVVAAIAIAIGTSGGGSGKGQPSALGNTPPKSTTATPTNPPAASTSTTPAQTQPTSPSLALRVTLPPSGKLSIGDTGPAVVTLQKVLATLGLGASKPDGNFGSATEAAVIKFQTAHGLKPDGIVGATTARKLNDALAAPGARG